MLYSISHPTSLLIVVPKSRSPVSYITLAVCGWRKMRKTLSQTQTTAAAAVAATFSTTRSSTITATRLKIKIVVMWATWPSG